MRLFRLSLTGSKMRTISTRKTPRQIKKIISQIPNIIAGTTRDPNNLHNSFWGTIALSLFTDINKAFDEKSLGGSDELGVSWPDISPKTKAYSRKAREGDLTNKQKYANNQGGLGLLSPREHKRWKAIFANVFHREVGKGTSEKDAKVRAAQTAWDKIIREGGRTKIEVLGTRNLLILRDTDRLYRSLLPGKATKNSYRKYNKDQIYIVDKGQLTVGTGVEYSAEVDKVRPLWASNIEPWLDRAVQKAMVVLEEKLRELLR